MTSYTTFRYHRMANISRIQTTTPLAFAGSREVVFKSALNTSAPYTVSHSGLMVVPSLQVPATSTYIFFGQKFTSVSRALMKYNVLLFRPVVASASAGAEIRVWDIEAGISQTLLGHKDEVCHIAWSPDGRCLASSDDDDLRVWDIATGTSRVFEERLLTSSLSFFAKWQVSCCRFRTRCLHLPHSNRYQCRSPLPYPDTWRRGP